MLGQSDLNELIELSRDIRILYAEDDIEVRQSVVKLLNILFNTIYVADNGQEALKIFQKESIDLVITDINMPIMNGIELIEHIKVIDHTIPTLIISAHGELDIMFKAIQAGIDGFIIKPIHTEQFLSSVKKVIEKTALQKAHNKNLAILKQYQEITNKSSIISKTDPNGIITFVNDNFCDISGYTQEELLGQPHNIVRHPDNPKKLFQELWHTIKIEKEPWQGIIKNLDKHGKSYYVKTTIKPLLDQDGNIVEYMALRDDISEIMSEKKQLLTSLESNSNSFLALIQIENFEILDRFYDAQTVEKIETIFGNTLLTLFPKSVLFEKIFKLGDGCFALAENYNKIIENHIDIEEQLLVLIKNAKNSTIKLENIEYDVSIAVSYCHGEEHTYENAKYGIEKAVQNHQSLVCANNLIEEAHKNAQKNIETIHMVKKALDNFNIVSYFQPIIHNQTKEIIKYESLVRLINDKGEIISPYFFLETSKKGTYYTKITERVIESSFKVLDHIKHNVSINLSVLDIENITIRNKLIEMVSNPAYKGRVTFELLEDENIKDFDAVKEFILLVKDIGNVKIAIDDFGSGYSNFERLLDYTPDILKIDGSLIRNIEHDLFSKNIVETIVTFAKKQNIETIAEFVENENIYNILNDIGIDYSQGYYFGRPEKLI